MGAYKQCLPLVNISVQAIRLVNGLTATSWGRTRESANPKLLTHRNNNCETIIAFEWLIWGMISHIAMDNQKQSVLSIITV